MTKYPVNTVFTGYEASLAQDGLPKKMPSFDSKRPVNRTKGQSKNLPKFVQLRQGKWFCRRSFPTKERDEKGNIKYIQIIRRIDPETEEHAAQVAEQIAFMFRDAQVEKARPLSVGDVVRDFVNARKRAVEYQTDRYYEAMSRRVAKSPFNDLIANEVTPKTVQDFYASIESDNLVRRVHTFLSMCFNQAVRWELVRRNPCKGVVLPKVSKPDIQIMTEEDARTFLQVCLQKFPIFALALETWMRPQEYLVLRWSEVDLAKRVIKVERALTLKEGGGYEIKKPKTKASRRLIRFSEQLRDMLAALPKTSDLIFPSEANTPMNPDNLSKRLLKRACETCGIAEYAPYALRHTGASIALAHGADIKAVSERLGHASIQITYDTYIHLLQRTHDQTMEIIEKALY